MTSSSSLRTSSSRVLIAAGAAVVLSIVACSSDPPKNGDGVNDVRKACEIKLTWIRENGNDCSVCEAAATAPRCSCSALVDASAACIDQGNARTAACPPNIDTGCLDNCDRNNCDCIEACYANNAACKAASAARDGCVAQTCDPHCH